MMNRKTNPATPPELICPLCSKSFESNKQTVRHLRYCRTKAKDAIPLRRKSCVACIKAKTRCDMTLPRCSRCENKGRQCHYKSSSTPSDLGVGSIPTGESLPFVHQVEIPLASSGLHEQTAAGGNPDDISARRGHSPYDYNQDLPADLWFGLQTNSGSSNVGGTAYSEEMLGIIPSDSSWNGPFDAFSSPLIYHFKDRVVLGSFYVVDVSTLYLPLDKKTILEKRDLRAGPHGSALSRAFILSTLRSYPEIMCGNDGTLPPFIHFSSRSVLLRRSSKYFDNLSEVKPEPLAICSRENAGYSIVRSPGNLSFIWKTIYSESRRIEGEYHSYDPWTTLAAMQAMSLYVILGLLDDNSEYIADGNILMTLLNTTKRLADRYSPAGWMCNEDIQHDQVPTWDTWALFESRRRTSVILVIIMHVFNISHGAGQPQCGGFANLALPCSKALWQASDQATWEAEYRKQYMSEDDSNGRSGHGSLPHKRVLIYRDLLLDLQDQNDPKGAPRMGDLSEWFAGMDELGTLVTMAISTL